MHISTRQDRFVVAYINAVVAAVGCMFTEIHSPFDIDKVDGSFRMPGKHSRNTSPQVDVQIKSWSAPRCVGDALRYPLDVETYDRLRDPRVHVPSILLVVVVHDQPCDWVTVTDETTKLRCCGYWVSLRGQPASANTSSVTVSVPMANRFTVEALDAMLRRVGDGDQP